MLSHTLLLTLAGVASANLMPGPLALKREIEARQTADSGCAEAMLSIATMMPTPPAALASFYATNTQTDPCSITYPASISAAMSSYGEAVSSFYEANADKWSSALAQCPSMSTLTDQIDEPSCTDSGNSGSGSGSGGSQTTSASDSEATGSSSGSGSGSGSSNNNNSPRPNAAAHDAGLTGAALAIAGFLGVVAAL